MKKIWNLFVLAATVCILACAVSSCGKSNKLDVQRINEVIEMDNDQITSSDINFLLDQIEILVNNTKDLSKEELAAYYESLDNEEQECVRTIRMMVSILSSVRVNNSTVWSDAQLERLRKLGEQLK